MANIPIRDITQTGIPTATSNIVFDDGSMKRATIADLADGVRPVASQSEAQTGSDNSKTMSPLRVKQSIASEVGVTIASKSQGDAANTALQPAAIGSTIQAYDADLASIAGLSPANNDFLQRKSGAWVNRTPAQAKADLSLSTVATSGSYNDLSGLPTLGDLAAKDQAAIADIAATGAPSSTTALFGDGTWKTPAGGGDMIAATYDPNNKSADAFDSGNTKFLQLDTDAVAQTVRESLSERLSVTQFKAVADADWTNAFQRAHDAAVARGGATIEIPSGDFEMSAFPTTGSYVIWQGGGVGTRLISTVTTGDFVTIAGLNSWIRDVCLTTNVRKTSGFMMVLGHGIIEGAIGVRIEYGYNGLKITDASQIVVDRVEIANLLGVYGIYTNGTSSITTTGMRFSNITVAGQPVPSDAVNKGAWAGSTAFNVKDVVTNAGALYICSTAGTSASTGGPSGLPTSGTTPQTAFSNTITDGSAQWQFLNAQTNLFVMDSYSYSLRMSNVGLLWGYQGFVMQDAAGFGDTSMPKWVHSAHNIECDTNWASAMVLSGGGGFHSTNSWWGTSKTSFGIFIASTFAGDVSIKNSRINNNYNAGLYISAGPKNVLIDGNFIGGNSLVGVGTSAGVVAEAGASGFSLTNNIIGPLPSLGTNANQVGVILGNSVDEFLISGNDLRGNNAPISVGTLPSTPGETFWIKDNRGLKTKMSAGTTLASAATTTTVTHGLATTPRAADIQITPAGGWGSAGQWSINSGTITSTTFDISTSANPGAGVFMNVRAGIWGDW